MTLAPVVHEESFQSYNCLSHTATILGTDNVLAYYSRRRPSPDWTDYFLTLYAYTFDCIPQRLLSLHICWVTMPEDLRQWARTLDIDQFKNDPEKLLNVANDLKLALLQACSTPEAAYETAANTINERNPPTTLPQVPLGDSSPTIWPGRPWVPAETNYPSDFEEGLSCFKQSHIEVVVYDCATRELQIHTGLRGLYDKRSLFASLPSRRSGLLRVCVEQMPPSDAMNSPRYRVTDKQVPKDMTCRHIVRLGNLASTTRWKILLGHIKWIFILNVSRAFSDTSNKSEG